MKKIIMTCLVAALLAGPAYASKEEKMQELFKVIQDTGALNETLNEQVLYPIECSFVLTSAEEKEVEQKLKNILNFEETTIKLIKPFYEENFTEEELGEIVAFYKTSAGKKTLTLLPKMGQYVSERLMAYMQHIMPKMETLLQDLSQNHKQRSVPEIQTCVAKKREK